MPWSLFYPSCTRTVHYILKFVAIFTRHLSFTVSSLSSWDMSVVRPTVLLSFPSNLHSNIRGLYVVCLQWLSMSNSFAFANRFCFQCFMLLSVLTVHKSISFCFWWQQSCIQFIIIKPVMAILSMFYMNLLIAFDNQ